MELDPIIISAGSAVIGGFVGAVTTLLATLLRQRSEERKHYRALLISTALESWKEDRAVAKLLIQHRPRMDVKFHPLESYLVHMAGITDMIIDGKVNKSNVEELLEEVHSVSDKAQTWVEKRSKEKEDRGITGI